VFAKAEIEANDDISTVKELKVGSNLAVFFTYSVID
jgi:hypothetical protein